MVVDNLRTFLFLSLTWSIGFENLISPIGMLMEADSVNISVDEIL